MVPVRAIEKTLRLQNFLNSELVFKSEKFFYLFPYPWIFYSNFSKQNVAQKFACLGKS
jgi:hypothetical protein